MALYISIGDGVVDFRIVDLYWGRFGKVCRCRSLLERSGRVWRCISLLRTVWYGLSL